MGAQLDARIAGPRQRLEVAANDLMIAAHARSVAAIVVTNHTKDFGRIKGLEVENWMT